MWLASQLGNSASDIDFVLIKDLWLKLQHTFKGSAIWSNCITLMAYLESKGRLFSKGKSLILRVYF